MNLRDCYEKRHRFRSTEWQHPTPSILPPLSLFRLQPTPALRTGLKRSKRQSMLFHRRTSDGLPNGFAIATNYFGTNNWTAIPRVASLISFLKTVPNKSFFEIGLPPSEICRDSEVLESLPRVAACGSTVSG